MRRGPFVFCTLVLSVLAWGAATYIAASSMSLAGELDRARGLTNIAPRPQSTRVFDRRGSVAFSYYIEQRLDVPLAKISPHMIDAVLAVEDRRFFQHHGVDPFRIVTAAWRNVKARRIVEGGSTITQQLARASQLSPVRTYERKLREILIAAQLEERFSKSQILEEYLNTVYFGGGYYGAEAASRGYFGKSASDLSLPEAALLAALVRSPSSDAPNISLARATKRRNLVLKLMRKQGRITSQDLQAALAVRVPNSSRTAGAGLIATEGSGLYFQEEIRRQLFQMFGADRVLRGGLRVFSTYDPDMQREAEQSIATRIAQIAKTRAAARDLQGGLVAMNPQSGEVYALVGGRDFHESSFNRATQARRQAGSAFKPIIYAAALERGYAPGTLLRDLDTPIPGAVDGWLPNGEHERDEYTLRRALKVSSNRAAAQVLQQVGVTTAVYYAQRLGINSQLPLVPSLALGTGEVTLIELTTAYSAFANQGVVVYPRLINRVEDASGKTIWHAEERSRQAVSATTAYLMSSMLSDVIASGTGARARSVGFTLPAGGKTGTTDDYSDAWFIGYTPHLLTGVWFGLDRPAPIMREGFGGVVAVPAWARFMRAATKDAKPEWYRMPSDVEKVAICRLSGARAGPGCRDAYFVPVSTSGSQQAAATDVQGAAAATGSAMSVAQGLPPGEPMVYEDLFPVGAIPSEICPLHNGVPAANAVADAALHHEPSSSLFATGAAIRSAATRLYVDRIPTPDGSFRFVVRQAR